MALQSDKREKGIKGNKREKPFGKEKGKGNNTYRVFPFLLSLNFSNDVKEKGMEFQHVMEVNNGKNS